ncbi:MAG: HipA N-terminal domain-containing protein [Bacteroidetes bacterium]|nr:HipA N-terminal domain-containing protein [Bacteroidota bacterium]
MRKARVLFKGEEAGVLTQSDDGSFLFQYTPSWTADSSKPSISLTLPKTEKTYHSRSLFPFFYNMLPEGSNKQIVSKLNRIDKDDYFGLLMATAKSDTIGAVTVLKMEDE